MLRHGAGASPATVVAAARRRRSAGVADRHTWRPLSWNIPQASKGRDYNSSEQLNAPTQQQFTNIVIDDPLIGGAAGKGDDWAGKAQELVQILALAAAAGATDTAVVNATQFLKAYCLEVDHNSTVTAVSEAATVARCCPELLPHLATVLRMQMTENGNLLVLQLKVQAARAVSQISVADDSAIANAILRAGLVAPLSELLLLAAARASTNGLQSSQTTCDFAAVLSAACYAAEAISNLTDGSKVDDATRVSIVSAGALSPLVELLHFRVATSEPPTAAVAARALAGLARASGLRKQIAAAGAVPPLVGLLSSSKDDEAGAAAEALTRMATGVPAPTTHPLMTEGGEDGRGQQSGCDVAGASAAGFVSSMIVDAGGLSVLAELLGRLQSAWRRCPNMVSCCLEDCSFWAVALLEEMVGTSKLQDQQIASEPGLVSGIFDVLLMGGSSHVPRQATRLLCKMVFASRPSPLFSAVTEQLRLKINQLSDMSISESEAAAAAVYWLIAECPELHELLVLCGVIPPFVGLLYSDDVDLAALAAIALCDLAQSGGDSVRDAITAAGALPPIVALLRRRQDQRAVDGALDALFSLLSGGGDLERRRMAAHAAGARAALLDLLKSGALGDDARQAGVSMMLIKLGLE